MRGPDGVSAAAPYVGPVAVTQLRHAADIYHLDAPAAVGTLPDGLRYGAGTSHVDEHCFLGMVVGVWRHHAAHMQHIVGVAYATLYGVCIRQGAADHCQFACLGKPGYLTVCVGMTIA